MKHQFRLKADAYCVALVWEFCGVVSSMLAFPMRPHSNFWQTQLLALLVFHGPVLLGVWCIVRARIFVDERGLYFQKPFKTHFVAWGEIEDFGWELPPEGNNSPTWREVLWIDGKKKRLSSLIKNADQLREWIASKATNAPAREWALLGTRDCDTWPRTFVYHDTPNWVIAAQFFGVTALMLLKISLGVGLWGRGKEARSNDWEAIATNLSQLWNALEWWGQIGFVGVCTFLIFAMPTLILVMSRMGLKTKRRFLEQRIVVTREGLEQWNGPSRRVCAWGDIERFGLERVTG